MKRGEYTLHFEDGGVQILKNGKVLFFNRRPVYVSVKTEEAMLRFRDIPYGKVTESEEGVRAYAEFVTGNGSVLRVEDRYSDENVSGMQRKGWAES